MGLDSNPLLGGGSSPLICILPVKLPTEVRNPYGVSNSYFSAPLDEVMGLPLSAEGISGVAAAGSCRYANRSVSAQRHQRFERAQLN